MASTTPASTPPDTQAGFLATHALGILETTGWTPAMVALDEMEKAGTIEVWQVELNDFLGTCVKVFGPIDALTTAIQRGVAVAEKLNGSPKHTIFPRASGEALRGIESRIEFNPLIQQHVVKVPPSNGSKPSRELTMSDSRTASQALGFIETQGFTAVFEAVDRACKAAQVEVVGKEKLGGGYVTIVIRGDVAAVRAAIDAAEPAVGALGKLIAAHVIARPSASVLSLLPQ